ncbi:MAG: UTP--glucose-1-phosphate uridylyltransferase, partial [Chloroflexia bacterium]|nr:UTP--glucose-1-phosphate uridylyltransferase [Chloroflexia bacterium]
MSRLCAIIIADDALLRDSALESVCGNASYQTLLAEIAALEVFRQQRTNLYERVRALFFLYAIHRFYLPAHYPAAQANHVPYEGYVHLLNRRFEESVALFGAAFVRAPSDALSSALATAYHQLAFQTLADQVRQSVRAVRGNQWMFRMGHPADYPLRIHPRLLTRDADQAFPILQEATPVRMDLSHSGWSDIFFLGMDFPAGAQVLNISVDLCVRGRDATTRPPVEAYLRVIDEPLLRLTSVDLGVTADISELGEVFDFGRDYLGLLKGAVIAAGIIPPGLESSQRSLADVLARLVGPGHGIELVSSVNDIPKGSRLAVSTNLLAALICVCMRATGQTVNLTGALHESERRLVAARAILGEWLAGSGGGWQDSGGVWPGIKLITGVESQLGDPEYGVSRGRLLPQHRVLSNVEISPVARQRLQDSLVLVHGGMAQNVGPILEMVTEKYLLRAGAEWQARQDAIALMTDMIAALKAGDIQRLGQITTRNFMGPLQTIIPWATNRYTEGLIRAAKQRFGDQFWGFWMLGGMSGGGMGFIVDPVIKVAAQNALQEIMDAERLALQDALPFAMKPVVYDFAINERGTWAELLPATNRLMPVGYYALHMPRLLRATARDLNLTRRRELDYFGAACLTRPELARVVPLLFNQMLPHVSSPANQAPRVYDALLQNGFDRDFHEQIRADMRAGRIGLMQNRLPVSSVIRDVDSQDVHDATRLPATEIIRLGEAALARGEVAVVSLAGGAGSRWTQGAGVVKALHPFAKLAGRHRTFIELHIAKSQQVARRYGTPPAHVFTTSYMTDAPLRNAQMTALSHGRPWGYTGDVLLSHGKAVGLRFIPMTRDLRFAWEETPHQILDDQAQKMRQSVHTALIGWARAQGEGADYTDNLPQQCMHPVGHWFEVPNMLRNGTLAQLLQTNPNLRYLMVHNIDTLGATLDPALLGLHIASQKTFSFEVTARRIDDRGGGLARVDDQVRVVEGLAMPRITDEFGLRFYNTLTNWVDIDGMLTLFGLTRDDIMQNAERVNQAVRAMATRMPTYVTIKDVKKRWGNGQEDIYPVAQFEKLWGDMTALPDATVNFLQVTRLRGQQLKDQAQLDGW